MLLQTCVLQLSASSPQQRRLPPYRRSGLPDGAGGLSPPSRSARSVALCRAGRLLSAAALGRAQPSPPPERAARARRHPRWAGAAVRRRGVGRRSREACFYTGVAGGAGRAEVRAGEGKRSDWTREAAGSAVRRRPWRRARPGPALIGEVGRA